MDLNGNKEHLSDSFWSEAMRRCPCVGRAEPAADVPTLLDEGDFFDVEDAKLDEDRLKEDWKWLSIRCERRLNEQLRFFTPDNERWYGSSLSNGDPEKPSNVDEFACFIPKVMRKFVHENIQGDGSNLKKELAEIANGYAAAMFCDVSGFTALAESIEESHDPEAAATLGRCLNSFYDPLIRIIHHWGGDILKFSGDAVLVVWMIEKNACEGVPLGRDEGLSSTGNTGEIQYKCSLCLKCCDELHKTLHDFPVGIGDKTLAMHIVATFGEISIIHVGGIMEHWDFVVGGRPLEEIAIAESLAQRGQTVISRKIFEILESHIEAEPIEGDECFLRLCRIETLSEDNFIELPEDNSMKFENCHIALFRCYIPTYIFFKLMSGYNVFNNEMRCLSTIFVSIPGLNVVSAEGREIAQKVVNTCQKAAYSLEGCVNKFLVDDKGFVILIFMGLPPLYHIDDPVRSIFVALKIESVCKKLGLKVGIGITTGKVWCGTLGNCLRKEYTALGDFVNLAARLMGKATVKGDHVIYVDYNTCKESEEFLEFSELDAIKLKGKSSLTKIFTPTGKVNKLGSSFRGSKTPLQTWKKWDTYREIKTRLRGSQSDLLNYGGVMMINGHNGSGALDLQSLIKGLIESTYSLTCFSLSTVDEGSLAISIASDPHCAWKKLCNGLIQKWASSESRKRGFFTKDSKCLHLNSDSRISKRVVRNLVKELLDPSLHWHLDAIKHLINGLESESLGNLVRQSLIPRSDSDLKFINKLPRILDALMKPIRPTDDGLTPKGPSDAQEVISDYDLTFLQQSLLNESMSPFITSMVEGYSMHEGICIILNVSHNASVHAKTESDCWRTMLKLANSAMERRRQLQRADSPTSGKPILFIVVSSSHYCFFDWYYSLLKFSTECNALFRVKKLSRPQVADFILHCLGIHGKAAREGVPEELVNHVYRSTSGMARFVYKTVQNLLESGAILFSEDPPQSETDTDLTTTDSDSRSDENLTSHEISNTSKYNDRIRRSQILKLFHVPGAKSYRSLDPAISNIHQQLKNFKHAESPLHVKRGKIKSLKLENSEIIEEIISFTMSILETLHPDELFLAKVANILPEPFFATQLLGSNPKGFRIERFEQIIRSLISNEILEPSEEDSVFLPSDILSSNMALKLCSNAIAHVITQRTLNEERDWLKENFLPAHS